MSTIYRLHADELTVEFLEFLKEMYHNKNIEISICETTTREPDETTYLLAHPANRSRLLSAIENVQQPGNRVIIDLDNLE
ncbi:MAG: hypothetical protein HQL74_10305 [Magnetococcales bacterium]|nr:hypothetical protein [Magnetococcales bacterium]